jgi:hypothetical protein
MDYQVSTLNVRGPSDRHRSQANDRERARAVMADLFRLTGHGPDEQPFAERALALLLEH